MSNELFNQVSKLMRDGQHLRATQMLKQLIAEQPGNPYLYYLAGTVLKDGGMPDFAIAYFSQSLKLDPEHTPVWLALGIAQQEAGRLEDAASTFRHIIEMDPDLLLLSYNSLCGRLPESSE